MTSEVTYFPQLKDYIIEKRLGTGTYAAVFKARSKVNEKRCLKFNFKPNLSLIWNDKEWKSSSCNKMHKKE